MSKKRVLFGTIVLLHIGFALWGIQSRFVMQDYGKELLAGALCDTQDAFFLRTAGILLGLLFVFLFWKFWFDFFSEKTGKQQRKLFVSVFIVLLLLICMVFPEMYAWENDNLGIYVEVLNGIPDFWHSYFTSAVYLGVLMSFKHPIMLPVLQSMFFSACFSKFYVMLGKVTQNKTLKVLSWLLVFHAGIFYVALMPYRNCFYTLLVFCVFLKIFDYYLKGEFPETVDLIVLALIGGVCAFWRSEGVLSLLFLPILLLFIGKIEKQKIYRLILFELVMILSFTVVSYPQKAAEKKYFGHDYMIVNILAMLSDVMRDDNYHTDYEGFESDIQAVEALYDPTMIKEWRSVAFQFTNLLKGNHPNRSMASEEEQEAFIKGSVGILLHNKIPLMKGRIHMCMEALSLMPENDSFGNTTISNLEEIDENLTVVSGEGEKLLFEKGILPGEIRDTLKGIWQVIYAVSMSVLQPITSGLLLILFFTMIALCIEMLIKKRWFFLFTGLYILSMVGVIVVFEPAAREAYYYPVYYQLVILFLFYLSSYEKKDDTLGETNLTTK